MVWLVSVMSGCGVTSWGGGTRLSCLLCGPWWVFTASCCVTNSYILGFGLSGVPSHRRKGVNSIFVVV